MATKKKVKAKTQSLNFKDNTIGSLIIKMIKADNINEAILETVIKKFPDCNTTIASISWYRNRLRRVSKSISTNRALKSKYRKSK